MYLKLASVQFLFSQKQACNSWQVVPVNIAKQIKMKKCSEMQTLRAGCSKAKPKIFAPPQTPFLGARDSQNLIGWRRSLPLSMDPVWWRSMHAISSYRGNRPTHTNTQSHRQDRLQYTLPLGLACSAITKNNRCKIRKIQQYHRAINVPINGASTTVTLLAVLLCWLAIERSRDLKNTNHAICTGKNRSKCSVSCGQRKDVIQTVSTQVVADVLAVVVLVIDVVATEQ